ncbi:hypothetical protein JCM19233_5942 [Vibrio astriarenae]|nr:hypothetical protein JCM19233_5942 [Vibrio sp. C7]
MKKPLILMLAVAGSVMSASALAKVSYADALESNRPAKEARFIPT